MRQVQLLLICLLLSIIPSQLIRINITSTAAINITDLLIGLTVLSFILYVAFAKKKVSAPSYIFPASTIFLLSAITSTVLSLNFFKASDVIISSLFLLRIIFYLAVPVVVINVINQKDVNKYLSLVLAVGVIFSLIGFIQFIVFPNLSSLEVYGWDPHINRLVSTTLDPNYTGGILTIFTSICLSLFLYKSQIKYALLAGLFSLAILLTFSRSSYFAYAVSTATIAVVKSPKVIFIPLILFIITLLFIPVGRQRIIGALTVDKTSQSRIESWQKAITIIVDHPFFGVGFNNYRSAQAKYGFFPADSYGGHSGGGTDSSLLFVLATTGIFGFALYLAWLTAVVKIAAKNLNKSPFALFLTASFFAIFVHSQFVNSLFFPQIMLLLLFFVGLKYVQDY